MNDVFDLYAAAALTGLISRTQGEEGLSPDALASLAMECAIEMLRRRESARASAIEAHNIEVTYGKV